MIADHPRPPRGVYAAVATPFTRDLEPDLRAFVAHGRWLLDNGCDGLAPLGTTGEANSLSVGQRRSLIEAAAEAGLPMDRFIIGAGSCALADAIALTRSAVRAGCHAALLLPPFYYKGPSEDGLFAFFAELIERVADPALRVYLYHFPQLSTVPIATPLIARLMKAYGERIAGLKDSSGEWSNTAALLREFPGFGVYSGSEQFLLDNLRAGGAGCISATTNVTAALAQRVFAAAERPEAESLQRQATEARLLFQRYPMQAAVKLVIAEISGDRAWLNLLPPNRPLSAPQAAELVAQLRALPQLRRALKPVAGAA